MPRGPHRQQAGRHYPLRNFAMGMGQQVMPRGPMGPVGNPRYPPGAFSGYQRAFWENPYAAGAENQRRNRHQMFAEQNRMKYGNRYSPYNHFQAPRTPWGFGRPVPPMLHRRQNVFQRRSPYQRAFRSPQMYQRSYRPMQPMNHFQNRGPWNYRQPNYFNNQRFEPRYQNFRRRPFEDDDWSDDDDFEDDDEDYWDGEDDDEDESFFSDCDDGFESEDDYGGYDNRWGAGRSMYQRQGRYGSNW